MGILDGKKGVILGIANNRSIAYGIAQSAHREGAELGISYQPGPLEKRVRKIAPEIGAEFIEPLDVNDDASMDAFFACLKEKWGKLDFLVHSLAYASKESLSVRFSKTRREDYLEAINISSYSFLALCHRAAPLMKDGGSLLTMTYLGSERTVPGYNSMGVAKAALEATMRYLAYDLSPEGIRVNAISAGPILTLAASGVAHFRTMLKRYAEISLQRRNITKEDVGDAAVYLLSDLAKGVSGEMHYVDGGFHVGFPVTVEHTPLNPPAP